jgi:hypothetical protein
VADQSVEQDTALAEEAATHTVTTPSGCCGRRSKATLMLAKTAEKPKPNELLTYHLTMKRAND